MSVILSGPRRVYVVLLFWERVADVCSACPRALSRVEQAVGAERSTNGGARCDALWRQVATVRLQRILGRRFIGLRLLVLEPQR